MNLQLTKQQIKDIKDIRDLDPHILFNSIPVVFAYDPRNRLKVAIYVIKGRPMLETEQQRKNKISPKDFKYELYYIVLDTITKKTDEEHMLGYIAYEILKLKQPDQMVLSTIDWNLMNTQVLKELKNIILWTIA
jgi:hypothetical protein